MIEIKRHDKYSIEILYDEIGAGILIEELNRALNVTDAEVISDSCGTEIVFKKNNEENMIVFEANKITITMDEEEIEYARKRFVDSMINKYFFPAELCECNYKKNSITIYACFKK